MYLVDPHLRTPYLYQYNLSLQHNLFADTVLSKPTTSEVQPTDSRSSKDINPMVLGTTSRVLNLTPGNSDCGADATLTCTRRSPEFQKRLERQLQCVRSQPHAPAQGVQARHRIFTLMAYTYSHALDNASGFRQRNSTVPAIIRISSQVLRPTVMSVTASALVPDGICLSIACGLYQLRGALNGG